MGEEVSRGGGVADGHIDVPTVGGGDEATVGLGQSVVPGEGPTGAKVGDGLPGADLQGSVVAAGFVAEVGGAGVVGRREYEGLLTERMEVWVEETALSRSMVVSRTAWWRWMLKNWLPEQSRQWKGDSSALMVEPQEHRKGPGAQTSEDAGGVKGAYGGTWWERKEYRP